MKKENDHHLGFKVLVCFIVYILYTVYACPIMALAQPENETEKKTDTETINTDIETGTVIINRKMTIEEARELSEPSREYKDENGILYQLVNWELEEKTGEEKRIPMEKQVRYLGLEDGEEIPETIYAEIQPQLSGSLHKTDIQTVNEQWKDDLCLPVIFYSYGADEYQLGDIVISAENDSLLEATAWKGPLILDSLGLSGQSYHITSMVWNGEPFTDENGQTCRNAIALGERLLKDVEVIYKGEAAWKDPDFYELHVIYKAEEKEEGSTVELTTQASPQLPSPAPKQGPFWYLIRTGFVITIAIGLLGLLTGIILLLITKWRKKEEKDHF